MTTFLNDDLAPADGGEQAEAMAHDALVYELSVVLMRLDGNDGDPHHLIWCGGPTPEPWGDAWQKYEEQAEAVINAIGEGSAQAMVTAFGEREWVAQVVSSGPHNFPLLQWRSADVSLGTAIGTKLYLHPSGVMAVVVTDEMALAFHRATTDGDIGQEDVDTIKAGLRAVFDAYGVRVDVVGPRIAVLAGGVWLQRDTPEGQRNFAIACDGIEPGDLHDYAQRVSAATGIPLAAGVPGLDRSKT
jgi:hypothetical protein